MSNQHKYIPALGNEHLMSLYDPFFKWLMQENKFRHLMVQQAALASGQQALDLGCGTATLTILLKQHTPSATLIGLDGDPLILNLAQGKAKRENLDIDFCQSMSYKLPFGDNTFDSVVSSLVFHHLTSEDKTRTLREICRILRPGACLNLFDFGKPQNALARLIAGITIHLERTSDNIRGRLPLMMREAGFVDIEETAQVMTVFGALSLYRARKRTF
jgi:ubiquinone/menaquinone biosynthesis C-methylase UbiE